MDKKEFTKYVKKSNNGCWLWEGPVNHAGYGRLENDRAHRISFRLFVGEIPDGLCVLHKCDVRLCVNPEHLFLGTLADNMIDRTVKGKSAKTLNSDTVLAIRQYFREGHSISEIASIVGRSISTVSRIANGKRWAWLNGKGYQP